jgi:cytoskeletal protein CcmA (bactofilin family)
MFFSRKSDSEEKRDTVPPPTLPARPPGAQKPIGFETVIGPGCILEGTLRSNGNLRLDGTFTGTLEIIGNILVGETARIEADVDARNISIGGMVRGNVTGNKVQLLRTARVWGDITATALTTEEGAFIDGRISMTEPPPAEELVDEPDEVPVVEDVAEVVAEVVEETSDAEPDLDEPPFVDAVFDQEEAEAENPDTEETEETTDDDDETDDD